MELAYSLYVDKEKEQQMAAMGGQINSRKKNSLLTKIIAYKCILF